MTRIGACAAKTHLSALLDRVGKGEEFTIPRHGVAVARLTAAVPARRRDIRVVIERIRELRRAHPRPPVDPRNDRGRPAPLTAFVLDASVAAAWLFRDQADAYTDAVLASLGRRSAVVPALFVWEMAKSCWLPNAASA